MNTTNQNLNGNDNTPAEIAAAQITAYALGQLPADERAAMEHGLRGDRGGALNGQEFDHIRAIADTIITARNSDPLPERSAALRSRLEERLAAVPIPEPAKRRTFPRRWAIVGWAVAATLLIGVILFPVVQSGRVLALRSRHNDTQHNFALATQNYGRSVITQSAVPRGETYQLNDETIVSGYPQVAEAHDRFKGVVAEPQYSTLPAPVANPPTNAGQPTNGLGQSMNSINDKLPAGSIELQFGDRFGRREGGVAIDESGRVLRPTASALPAVGLKGQLNRRPTRENLLQNDNKLTPAELAAATAQAANDSETEVTKAAIEVAGAELQQSEEMRQKNPRTVSESQLRKDQFNLEKSLAQRKKAITEEKITDLTANAEQAQREAQAKADEKELFIRHNQQLAAMNKRTLERSEQGQNNEQYAPIYENQFLSPLNQPLSTFSIDVDTASYANTRRFLTSNRLPPRNAVRIEELVNYFRYDYPQPKDGKPFSVNMEVAECPWKDGHLVLRVGLKGKDIERSKRPASNLVFLLDVSGSMSDENKLPLLKTAMKLLVAELGENDRVSIVTYAGDAGLKLPSARGHEQKEINAAIDSLSAGGSTNGSAGIELAYDQATAHFIKEGTNRVILCTDGDLNVGITSDEALVKLIKDKAKTGVFLTVLGFGEGNLKDAKMESLADNGNGLYAYIDSVREAKKVLVEQLTGSTITIAKDVKIQIEFNPAQIAAYRLLGYENRVLAAQDFNNDKKDAGEIGAGHTVTALYELVPVGAVEKPEPQQQPGVDSLKYQNSEVRIQNSEPKTAPPSPESRTPNPVSADLLTLKLRYKAPDADTSQLLEFPLQDRGRSFHSASPDFQLAAAVASFGMVLRNSQYRGSSNLAAIEEIASGAIGADAGGYRAEFIDLVRKAQTLGAR